MPEQSGGVALVRRQVRPHGDRKGSASTADCRATAVAANG